MRHLLKKYKMINIILVFIIILEFIFILNFKIVIGSGISMYPTIDQHQVLLCKYTKDYKVGDIVYYEIDGIPIVHRIIKITTHTLANGDKVKIFQIKGDNNSKADVFEVYEENIRCKIRGIE